MARKHKVDEVLRTLGQKNDISIFSNSIQILKNKICTKNGVIPNPKKKNDLGNGSWGKIDFLTNYHGFFINYVEKF